MKKGLSVMKTENFRLTMDVLVYFASLVLVLIPFYAFFIIGKIEYELSTQILFLYAGAISIPVIKGFFSATIDLLIPHIRIENNSIFIRPPGKVKGINFRWKDVVSVKGIMDGMSETDMPIYYDIYNKEGISTKIYSCGLLKKDRGSLDELLRKRFTTV